MDQPTITTPKPSGIPRFSRLPVLRSKSSQTFTQPPEISDNYRPAAATPKLQKRASAASLPKASQALAKAAIPAISARPRPNISGSKSYERPATGTLRGLTRPSSRGNQQRAPPAAPKRAQTEDEENHDQLGSLNGFHTASRQGSHDDSSPIEYEEPAHVDEEMFRPRDRSKSRPSLSERTMESLQNMPSTPKERRESSFFSPGSPMGPPLRPASALSRNGSSRSRPGTSDGTFQKPTARPASPAKRAPASARPAAKVNAPGFELRPIPTSAKRPSVSTALATTRHVGHPIQEPRSPSPAKQAAPSNGVGSRSPSKPVTGSKTVAARPIKARPALGDIFGSLPHGTSPYPKPTMGDRKPKLSATPAKRVTSNPMASSSTALREQIAAAKAAVRKEKAKNDSPQQIDRVLADTSDIATHMSADPFNLAPKDPKHILRNRIKTAWTDGRLNIAGMGLKQIPHDVLRMFDAKAMEEGNVNWAEVVDLTRLLAADNELESFCSESFPDKPAEQWAEGGEVQTGSPFGGLENLDLHGNSLSALPMGMRRLERLTIINLAHNKLDNGCLDVVSQIQSLKELRLGHNNLSGNLSGAICGLISLEVLDVQANRLLSLPEVLRELVSLRVLNVAGNQLTALPMEAIQQTPLSELSASNNALIGSLFPLGGPSSHSTLQTLNIANNSLAALTFSGSLDLPQLRTLDVTNNHFTGLPPMHGWTELVTLTAGDNKITELPEGFTSLQKLRNVNLTSNELRMIDPEIARMLGLEVLILAANPLREKKYLSMNAADIKRDLKAKLEPEEAVDGDTSDLETIIGPGGTGLAGSRPAALWSLQSNGLLDLASANLSDDSDDRLGSTLRTNEVRELRLQRNSLSSVPPALWLGQDLRILDLSNKPFAPDDYLSAELELPVLQELNLAHCRLASLEPLTTQLTAPALRTLNIIANKLAGPVPKLRDAYPALTILYARDNSFDTLSVDALSGLATVDLAGNALRALPYELGLLWDQGLRNLDVGGNPFRVPSYQVLGKGTEATLRWLRDKLPVQGQGSRVEEAFGLYIVFAGGLYAAGCLRLLLSMDVPRPRGTGWNARYSLSNDFDMAVDLTITSNSGHAVPTRDTARANLRRPVGHVKQSLWYEDDQTPKQRSQ
ncbi:hypothetical protein LTR12_007016 [Friedmanniomyces endolithicus]|nr:hypothetical protein LTR12_007016 [Friedmanniomyces endolithicus]